MTGVDADTHSMKAAVSDQVRFCNHLLEIHGDKITMCHSSAREFLLQAKPGANELPSVFEVSIDKINQEMTDVCLAHSEFCFLDTSRAKTIVKSTFEQSRRLKEVPELRLINAHSPAFQLMIYALKWWSVHIQSLQASYWEHVIDQPFWQSRDDNNVPRPTTKYRKAQPKCPRQWWWIAQKYIRAKGFLLLGPFVDNSLFSFACYFGIFPLVHVILSRCNTEEKLMWQVERPEWADKRTPLMHACEQGHVSIVRLLLARGVQLDSRDWEGKTTLFLACNSGIIEIVDLLLQSGVDLSLQSLSDHDTTKHLDDEYSEPDPEELRSLHDQVSEGSDESRHCDESPMYLTDDVREKSFAKDSPVGR